MTTQDAMTFQETPAIVPRVTRDATLREADGFVDEFVRKEPVPGVAYGVLLKTDPTMLQAQLQTYAAALDDPDVRQAVRDGYGDLYTYVERVSGVSAPRLARFFAMGMLFNVVGAMGLHEEEEPEPWAVRLMAGCNDPNAE